jgi:hypothetical protein
LMTTTIWHADAVRGAVHPIIRRRLGELVTSTRIGRHVLDLIVSAGLGLDPFRAWDDSRL